MKDQSKTKQVLIQEMASLRQRIEELEQSESVLKKEKEGLEKSEARFRSYFNLPMHGIAIISPEKGWIEVNDRICSMIGYSKDEIVRMTWSEMTHPDDLAANLKQFNRVLSGQIDHYNMDKRFIRKDGKVVWTNLSVGSVRKPDGSVDHMLAVVEDITDRKRIETALRASEERFSKIFQASPAPTYISTISDGHYIDVNNSGLQLLGYTREEMIGHTVRELGIWHTSSERKSIIRKLIAQGFICNEPILLRTKKGEAKETLLSCEIIRLDHEEVMLSLVYDITELRKTEEALRKRDILFKKISSWVPGMIYQFMKRPDGTYCMPFTTEAIKDIFGCSPQDVREDFSPIARVILPEDFDKVINTIEDSAQNMINWTCECRVQIPGQPIRWVLGNSTPEKLADGGITWHGFITDITERKRAEDELRVKTKDLEEANTALKVLLNQLEKGRDDLEERILSNIRELILPYINNLRHGKLSVHQVSLVDTIESNLNRISSSFLQHLKLNFYNLTPREIEIANLVKEGRSIKEIAELLGVTKKTIEFHRSSLRNKMGIKNKKANLRSHLLNI